MTIHLLCRILSTISKQNSPQRKNKLNCSQNFVNITSNKSVSSIRITAKWATVLNQKPRFVFPTALTRRVMHSIKKYLFVVFNFQMNILQVISALHKPHNNFPTHIVILEHNPVLLRVHQL